MSGGKGWSVRKPASWHVHGAAQIRRGGSFGKTSHAARRDLRPTGWRSVAGWDRLGRGAVKEFGNEWCGWEIVDFGWGTDLLDVSVIHHHDAIS